MDFNQLENQSQNAEITEPEKVSDNSSQQEKLEILQDNEGKSSDPSLILGKFKSQEDLIKAYQNLEKLQGNQAFELGSLRKDSEQWREAIKLLDKKAQLETNPRAVLDVVEKYNAPEYFQNGAFRQLFHDAYKILGADLDADYLVGLLDEYVSNRIEAYEKRKLAEAETQSVLDSMNFEKNLNSSVQKPKKRVDEMTPQEIDDLLDRLI